MCWNCYDNFRYYDDRFLGGTYGHCGGCDYINYDDFPYNYAWRRVKCLACIEGYALYVRPDSGGLVT